MLFERLFVNRPGTNGDTDMDYFEIYSGEFPAGQVCLGGNGDLGAGNNYIVAGEDIFSVSFFVSFD